jgi:hypothetical protein
LDVGNDNRASGHYSAPTNSHSGKYYDMRCDVGVVAYLNGSPCGSEESILRVMLHGMNEYMPANIDVRADPNASTAIQEDIVSHYCI